MSMSGKNPEFGDIDEEFHFRGSNFRWCGANQMGCECVNLGTVRTTKNRFRSQSLTFSHCPKLWWACRGHCMGRVGHSLNNGFESVHRTESPREIAYMQTPEQLGIGSSSDIFNTFSRWFFADVPKTTIWEIWPTGLGSENRQWCVKSPALL